MRSDLLFFFLVFLIATFSFWFLALFEFLNPNSKLYFPFYEEVDVDSYTYRQLIILILQFLAEENFEESLHLYGEIFVHFLYFFFLILLIKCEFESSSLLNHFSHQLLSEDWSKSRRFISILSILGIQLSMVSGRRQRTIFLHLQEQVIVCCRGIYSWRCESRNVMRQCSGISWYAYRLQFWYFPTFVALLPFNCLLDWLVMYSFLSYFTRFDIQIAEN